MTVTGSQCSSLLAAASVERPYRADGPYRFADRLLFSGRERETRVLSNLVIIYRGVLLYGVPGIGKTSLLEAGLVPAMLEKGFVPNRVGVQLSVGGSFVIERISTNGEHNPQFLPSSFAPSNATEARVLLRVADFAQRVHEVARDQRVLLLFDEFHKLFTEIDEAESSKLRDDSKTAQQAILSALDELLSNQNLSVKLVFSFDERYLAQVVAALEDHPELSDQGLRLTFPDANCLRKIVRTPFEDTDLQCIFRKRGNEITPSLAERIVKEFTEGDESDKRSLTELQLVCDELWKSADPDSLIQSSGGVKGLLARRQKRPTIENVIQRYKTPLAAAAVLLAMVGIGLLVATRLTLFEVESEKERIAATYSNLQKKLFVTESDLRTVRADLERTRAILARTKTDAGESPPRVPKAVVQEKKLNNEALPLPKADAVESPPRVPEAIVQEKRPKDEHSPRPKNKTVESPPRVPQSIAQEKNPKDDTSVPGAETIRGVVAAITAEGEVMIDHRSNRAVAAESTYFTILGSPISGRADKISRAPADPQHQASAKMERKRPNVYIVWLTPRTKISQGKAPSEGPSPEGANTSPSNDAKREISLDALEVGDRIVITFVRADDSASSAFAHQTEQIRAKHGRHRTYVGFATEVVLIVEGDERGIPAEHEGNRTSPNKR